ncbi:MAG: pentapeptide repeat-containing protein [Cyanobacteria bacterium SZAS-4]|nr:pentapeptide repeat-containing protein [Cyanobacteria bacterium SZAS-4]
MDVAETGISHTTTISQLDAAAHQAEKFSLAVTFELANGNRATFKIVCKGPTANFEAEQVGYKNRTPSVHPSLEKAMRFRLHDQQVKSMKALDVKAPKSPLSVDELRALAIAAWAEVADITCPDQASVGKDVGTAAGLQREMRDLLTADLRGGADGLKRFHARDQADKAVAKSLKELDLSDLDLTGLSLYKSGLSDFRNSNFKASKLVNAMFTFCDVSECNFDSAIMDGANLQSAGCSLACFAHASLVQAIFRGATLTEADFSDANLTKVDFGYADLRAANLETANLTDVNFEQTRYDENTRWPVNFEPPIGPNPANPHAPYALVFAGKGRDPFVLHQVRAMAPEGGTVDFKAFLLKLEQEFDPERLKKALKMLKAESFQLFAEVAPDSLVGVVKSQTDANLVYSCRLTENGSYACCTQNLNPCGGLRGALCKHLLVLLIGITKGGELDAAKASEWVISSARFRNATLDKDVMTATLLRYKGAEAGEIDWRPTETMPEDYYAY